MMDIKFVLLKQQNLIQYYSYCFENCIIPILLYIISNVELLSKINSSPTDSNIYK